MGQNSEKLMWALFWMKVVRKATLVCVCIEEAMLLCFCDLCLYVSMRMRKASTKSTGSANSRQKY